MHFTSIPARVSSHANSSEFNASVLTGGQSSQAQSSRSVLCPSPYSEASVPTLRPLSPHATVPTGGLSTLSYSAAARFKLQLKPGGC